MKYYSVMTGFLLGIVAFILFFGIVAQVQAQEERVMQGTLNYVAPTQRTDGSQVSSDVIAGYMMSYRFLCDEYDWVYPTEMTIGLSFPTPEFMLPDCATGMEWRVIAIDLFGIPAISWSDPVQDLYIYPFGKMNTPTFEKITNAELNVSWMDNSDDEDGFIVERKTDAEFAEIQTVGFNVTSYLDQGLAERTNYCYRVLAYNLGGQSPYSNEACAVTTGN